MGAYEDFLARKAMVDPETGFVPGELPDVMFPFQADITRWALKRGRAAIFAGTGLGKSLMELAWGKAVADHTALPVLHLAPLAVAAQMVREAVKFGIDCRHVSDQSQVGPGINITNYQKLDHFDLAEFGGVILDESSILKSTDGHYRTKLIQECQQVPFRLAATATPAPNDFMELGNHAEFLGVMSYTDMLATFFTHDGGDTAKWRLKGHAENEFWKWMASWSVMIRKPSDLGYDDTGYDLPPLTQVQHTVKVERPLEDGALFASVAATMSERVVARRDTIPERVAKAVEVVTQNICVKLPECLAGNLNTKQTDLQKLQAIRNMLSAYPDTKSAILTNSKHTCESIISETNIDTQSEPKSKKTRGMLSVESDTQQTKTTAKKSRPKSEPSLNLFAETRGLSFGTESDQMNMTNSCDSKTDVAQSVECRRAEETADDLPSITVTTLTSSVDYYAETATKGLAYSQIIETGLIEPLNISQRPKISPCVIWCQLNEEQSQVKAAFGSLAISIHGGHTEEEKERLHEAWLRGDAPILICKPKMFSHGCNWQHCNETVFVGLNDSFEQVYQAVRRFWRFGQTKPVTAHMIAADTEGAVVQNLRRKEADADRMAASMVAYMKDLSTRAIHGTARDTRTYEPTKPVTLPAWLN